MAIARIRSSSPNEAKQGDSGEDELVQQAQSDPDAFAVLYQRHIDDVYRYCLSRLNNREAAADATSQVFTQEWAALPRFRSGTFKGWLFTIARNVTVDASRRRRPHSMLDDASEVTDTAPNPEDQVLASEERATLVRLLAQLPPNQRSVVELRLVGASSQEIATVLNISLSAVKALQFRAYSRLRFLLADEEKGAQTGTIHAKR